MNDKKVSTTGVVQKKCTRGISLVPAVFLSALGTGNGNLFWDFKYLIKVSELEKPLN